MENLPIYVSLLFAATTFLTLYFLWKATRQSRIVVMIVLLWLFIQSIISSAGFYKVTDTIPPRFILLVLPPVIFITALFFSQSGKRFIDSLDIRWLTILHIVRIPVELVLLMLFIHKLVPQVMTFEGRNLDILSGITTPIIYYVGFLKHKSNTALLIGWNILCLLLLINIVAIAVLSAPFAFQQFGFEQPNVAILSFPFVWLPCFIVPVVLFSHIVVLRQLVLKKENRMLLEVE